MTKTKLSNLIKKKFIKSETYSTRVSGWTNTSRGFEIEYICDCENVILKRRRWNIYTKKMEDVRSYEYIPTDEVEITWVNGKYGLEETRIAEVSEYLTLNNIDNVLKNEKIIVKGIEFKIPNKIREILTH